MRFLHTRLKVNHLEKSISFYEKLGFDCRRRNNKSPQGNMIAFMHLGDNAHFLELTYNPKDKVIVPEDLVHTAIGVDDIIDYCSSLEKKEIEIWPNGWKEGFENESLKKMAFVTDPDGYEVEILER